MILEVVVCLIVGYLFGCFSTGYFYGKLNNIDVREHGSGNIGTTNALRTLGKKAGLITLLGDILKTILPIILLSVVFKDDELSYRLIVLYTGLGAVCGHNFPFWLNFHGGKGIAAMAGIIIMFSPWVTLIEIIVFFGIAGITRYVSLGSLAVSVVLPLCVLFGWQGDPNYIHMIIVCCILMVLAFVKHRANIKRLLNGTENKLGQKAK